MKKCLHYLAKPIIFLTFVFLLLACNSFAQRNLLIKKDSIEIKFLKPLVDTINYNKIDVDLVKHKKDTTVIAEEEKQAKPLQFTFGIGLSLGNVLEFNSASGADKKHFSTSVALDLGLNFNKEGAKFAMTNELHWTIGLQKTGITSNDHIQRTTDDLNTLHDFSLAISKNTKWNFNLIAKTNTSFFTIFDGDYFKDYNQSGKIQGFLSPYDVTLSPGFKYQPNAYFRLSISPYSINLYGLRSQEIANTGFYTQNFDANNNYDLFVFKQLGAEVNIWYDRKVKKWLDMQYRLGISSDYLTNIFQNGLVTGLFITKVKIIKNVYLSHRAILKGDIANKPFKPYYNQTILITFAKSF